MWIPLDVIFDRSESQKPARTNPLVNVPRNPKEARTQLNNGRDIDEGTWADPDDIVNTSVLQLSVWNSEDISFAQSTVDIVVTLVRRLGEETSTALC